MIKLIVDEKGNSKKIVSFLQMKYNKLPQSAIFKALRNKDIKVNGVRIKDNVTLELGDELEFFIKDDIIFGKVSKFTVVDKDIIYDDENILVYNKPEGIEVQGFDGEIGLEEAIKQPITEWKNYIFNDFEKTVFIAHPELAKIQEMLYEKGAIYAAMSGSGSTIYGIFDKEVNNINTNIDSKIYYLQLK